MSTPFVDSTVGRDPEPSFPETVRTEDARATRAWPAWLEGVRWMRTPVLVFLLTRLGIAAVAYFSVSVLPDALDTVYHLRGTENRLLDVFGSRWDTGFYVSIVEDGYSYQGVDLPSVAFFPLLPILMSLLRPLVGDAVVAGIVISNLALLAATILIYRLVLEEWDAGVAARTIWYLSVFPAAVFGSAIYTESLFLLTAAGAYYLARRDRWLAAGLFGIAAALTRLHGVLVAVLLLGEWWRRWRSDSQRKPSFAALAAPALTPLGTAAYMVFCWRTFGNPLAFASAASAWGRVPQGPFVTMTEALQAPEGGWLSGLLAGTVHVDNLIDLSMVLLFLMLGCALLALRRWGEGFFVVLGVTLSFGSGLLMSQRRYMWVLFPVFILLGQWGERPWVDRTISYVSVLGLALMTALFANGYWVG